MMTVQSKWGMTKSKSFSSQRGSSVVKMHSMSINRATGSLSERKDRVSAHKSRGRYTNWLILLLPSLMLARQADSSPSRPDAAPLSVETHAYRSTPASTTFLGHRFF